jgi:hypothetical protein
MKLRPVKLLRPGIKRRLLYSAAAASLLAAAALATFWTLSHGWYERVSFGGGSQLFTFESLGGEFRFVWIAEPGARRRPWAWRQSVEEPAGSLRRLNLDHEVFGFGFTPANPRMFPDGPAGATFRALGLPYWFATAALAALPVCALSVLVSDRRAETREREGMCRQCGYDLRATTGRCPECGADVGSSAASVLRARRDGEGGLAHLHPQAIRRAVD